MQSEAFLNALKQGLDDKKGLDIQVIDLRERTMFTDFFLLATGTSSTHVAAMANEVDRVATTHRVNVLGTEGMGEASWVLLDLGDVVVHLFQSQTRSFFNLEKLWSPKTMLLTTPESVSLAMEG
ncbi:MAG: iojap-like protein [Magnetococcales bacterium]|nr:iojap-like protein [Magnetococcales bacterium]HIJ85053.1 ribosome silencing factor [Magnetococcales bacterium]